MKWIKPSGLEIETNDRAVTIAYCESLGWKVDQDKPMTKKEIIAELERLKIEHNPKAKKADLVALLSE